MATFELAVTPAQLTATSQSRFSLPSRPLAQFWDGDRLAVGEAAGPARERNREHPRYPHLSCPCQRVVHVRVLRGGFLRFLVRGTGGPRRRPRTVGAQLSRRHRLGRSASTPSPATPRPGVPPRAEAIGLHGLRRPLSPHQAGRGNARRREPDLVPRPPLVNAVTPLRPPEPGARADRPRPQLLQGVRNLDPCRLPREAAEGPQRRSGPVGTLTCVLRVLLQR